jgi:hypothetical protein
LREEYALEGGSLVIRETRKTLRGTFNRRFVYTRAM